MSELHIEEPILRCGDCGFTVALRGEWSVEDGQLVFRADADPQPGRGPDLFYCGESTETVEFDALTFGYGEKRFSDEDFEALKRTAREAVR